MRPSAFIALSASHDTSAANQALHLTMLLGRPRHESAPLYFDRVFGWLHSGGDSFPGYRCSNLHTKLERRRRERFSVAGTLCRQAHLDGHPALRLTGICPKSRRPVGDSSRVFRVAQDMPPFILEVVPQFRGPRNCSTAETGVNEYLRYESSLPKLPASALQSSSHALRILWRTDSRRVAIYARGDCGTRQKDGGPGGAAPAA